VALHSNQHQANYAWWFLESVTPELGIFGSCLDGVTRSPPKPRRLSVRRRIEIPPVLVPFSARLRRDAGVVRRNPVSLGLPEASPSEHEKNVPCNAH
jgi:hypothetical protein